MMSLAEMRVAVSESSFDGIITDRFGGDEKLLLADFDSELNQLLRTNLEDATRYADLAARFSNHLSLANRPRLIAMKARVLHWRGKNDRARTRFATARDQFLKHRNYLDAAKTGMGLMDVYMYLGDYPKALDTGKKSLTYFRRKKMVIEAARAMTNIGNVYHRMDNNRMALVYYDRARPAFAKQRGVALAIVEFNRANIYANLNQLKEAEALWQTSADIYHRSGLTLAENQAKYSLAYLYFLEDKYAKALRMFEEVYGVFTDAGDVRSVAITQLDLVEVNLQLNQYGSAIEMGEAVIALLKRLKMRYEEAKAHFFVAVARMKLGDFVGATAGLKRAETLFNRESNVLWLAMASHARARLLVASGRVKQAVASANQTKQLFKRSGDKRRQIDAEITLVEARLKAGEIGQAIVQARKLSNSKLLSYQRYNIEGLIGSYYFDRGEYLQAVRHYQAAVRTIEDMIAGLYPDEIRFFFVVDKYESYARVVECLLKLERVDRAFLFNLRAIAMLNRRNPIEKRLRREVPAELIESRDRLRASLKRLAQAPRSGQRSSNRLSTSLATEQKLLGVQRRIRSLQYPAKAIESNSTIADFDPRSRLKPGETLVHFAQIGTQVLAFWSNRTDTGVIRLGVSTPELELLVRKLHFVFERAVFGLREADMVREASEFYVDQLHGLLIEPIIPVVGDRGLIVLADGLFGQVPFIALRDANGRYLTDQFDLSVLPNPQELATREQNVASFSRARNAVFAVSSEMLPAVEIEGRRIKEQFRRSTLYLDDEADQWKLREELQKSDGFVHIATHASRSSENPLFSRILMSDGPFFPFDLFGVDVSARLVTLSGCQTAAPGLYYGNSFSLAKAFYQAGARDVLASLWPVSDKVSMIFMAAFYRELRQTDDVATAYRTAVGEVRDLTNNPAFWGSFVLLGM